MKYRFTEILKFIAWGRLFIFLLIWLDASQVDSDFQWLYDKIDVDIPPIFGQFSKKCADILAGFIWFLIKHKHTPFDGLLMFICCVGTIAIDYYIEEPKSMYIMLVFLTLLVLWICYYFW